MYRFERRFYERRNSWAGFGAQPPANIEETDMAYVLTISAPGYQRENIKVSLHEDVLTVTGIPGESEPKGASRVREFPAPFRRMFRLNERVDVEKIMATLTENLLKIELGKKVG
jgi:HSP20 family protein